VTSSTQVQDKFITLSELKFHYREWGNADAPVLVLLHGLTAHARTWDTVAQAMQDRYRVLALDQRGHGETEWAKDYSWLAMRGDIGSFARALGLRKFTLLGHSMGGGGAYRYAGAYPGTVERLVIDDVGPPIPMPPALPSDPSAETPRQDTFDTKEEMVKFVGADFPHIQESELLTLLYYARQLDDGRWTWGHDPAGFDAINSDPSFPTPEELWALVSKITCPTLVVRGAESTTFSREQAERMMREIPNCRLVEIPSVGHEVQWSKPSEFIAAVRDFLTG
jgi:pimeloyl-ACP methyl ester carboxylesterase